MIVHYVTNLSVNMLVLASLLRFVAYRGIYIQYDPTVYRCIRNVLTVCCLSLIYTGVYAVTTAITYMAHKLLYTTHDATLNNTLTFVICYTCPIGCIRDISYLSWDTPCVFKMLKRTNNKSN